MVTAINPRYRRLTELFVDGKPLKISDGTHLWIQVINSYERDECVSDAQVARSRLILALKESGEERLKVLARMEEVGRDAMTEDLAAVRGDKKMGDIFDELQSEEEWKERMQIVMRTDFHTAAKPATPEEAVLMDKVNSEVVAEINRRQDEEREYQRRRLGRLTDEDFIDEWIEEWIDRRGSDLATAEFRLTEIWYATRFCDGVVNEDGLLDHTRCNAHNERVFPTKAEARAAPDRLQQIIRAALDDLNMAGNDPKDSGSQPSSSDSPPTPSEPEASTPSTSTETHSAPPGT